MTAVIAYRRLFSYSGFSYILFAFLGRMPLAMSQIGTLLLVQDATGSYGAGGVCAGALAIANAVGAPFFGSLADRIGQRPVVLVQSIVGALGLATEVALVWMGVSWPWIAVVAAFAGLACPQIGPLARVRWRPLTADAPDQGRLVTTAFSYEGAADEATFVLGPALVGAGIALVSPGFAMMFAAVVLAVFGTAFAMHPSAELVGRRVGDVVSTGRLLTAGLLVLTLAQFSIGVLFGSVQTGNSVIANSAGEPGMTGMLHALLGVGSVVAGIAMAAIPDRFPLVKRMGVFAVALLVLSAPLLLVNSIGWVIPVLVVLGFAIAPFMITNFSLAERITDDARSGAAMTLLAAATGLGYAVGAAIAGRLADSGGATPAYAVTVATCVLAVGISIAALRILPAPKPSPASYDPSRSSTPWSSTGARDERRGDAA